MSPGERAGQKGLVSLINSLTSGKKRDMEAKASKHASKRVHAVCRVRVRARARPNGRAARRGPPPRMGANSAAMRAASPKSKPAAASPASAASWSSPPARYARDIRRRARPRGTRTADPKTLQAHRASDARRRTSHGQLARNNLSTLKGLNAQPGVTVTVRAGAGPPPARLQRIADQAAQSGDLRSKHPADCASCANAPWDELRVWDPGD